MVDTYTPNRGDIVWAELKNPKGHEQKGRRSFLILSTKKYNEESHFAIACPITSQVKGYLFEVFISLNEIEGSILLNQLTSIDFKYRNTKFIEKLDVNTTKEIGEYFAGALKGFDR
ncbi:type II toxin-antitoxin system PemK/MazF family toxin [Candidatus Pacebacteria bacterium]|nr:type II toxin-antitoxin system PemK/MazF family toxin [Candidatus Paceibacterota bacterium]